jgi:predicted ATPase
MHALREACAAQPHECIVWQCSPYRSGSALWPVIQRMERAVGMSEHDSEEVLDKLEALIGRGGDAAALYATLLGLNGNQRYGPLEMAPQMLRERTLKLLTEQLFELAELRPLLLVVEDAHWIDPTTLELLDRCLEKIDRARVLMLITSRPDAKPAMAAYLSVTRLSLSRLSRASAEAIVARLGGDGLQAQTRATIVSQTDGVPLFVEELTKAVLETGGAAIPASLHGSLMARLDRLPEAKEVAQIAACIGREFDQVLVEAVAEKPEAVAEAISKLVAAELVFRRIGRLGLQFVFKHALVQEAAYESLLRSKRQSIHARLLEVLEARGNTLSEVLARHAKGAGQVDQAIGH